MPIPTTAQTTGITMDNVLDLDECDGSVVATVGCDAFGLEVITVIVLCAVEAPLLLMWLADAALEADSAVVCGAVVRTGVVGAGGVVATGGEVTVGIVVTAGVVVTAGLVVTAGVVAIGDDVAGVGDMTLVDLLVMVTVACVGVGDTVLLGRPAEVAGLEGRGVAVWVEVSLCVTADGVCLSEVSPEIDPLIEVGIILVDEGCVGTGSVVLEPGELPSIGDVSEPLLGEIVWSVVCVEAEASWVEGPVVKMQFSQGEVIDARVGEPSPWCSPPAPRTKDYVGGKQSCKEKSTFLSLTLVWSRRSWCAPNTLKEDNAWQAKRNTLKHRRQSSSSKPMNFLNEWVEAALPRSRYGNLVAPPVSTFRIHTEEQPEAQTMVNTNR